MNATALFVYGTLRHDQPEHARHCRGVTGWRRARVRGRLFRIPEGYLLLVVPAASILLRATHDAAADENRRASLDRSAIDAAAAAAAAGREKENAWIDGELLAFRDADEAWPPLDAWENFTPDRPGIYARCVVPVTLIDDPAGPRSTAAWTYASSEAPAGATPAD